MTKANDIAGNTGVQVSASFGSWMNEKTRGFSSDWLDANMNDDDRAMLDEMYAEEMAELAENRGGVDDASQVPF